MTTIVLWISLPLMGIGVIGIVIAGFMGWIDTGPDPDEVDRRP